MSPRYPLRYLVVIVLVSQQFNDVVVSSCLALSPMTESPVLAEAELAHVLLVVRRRCSEVSSVLFASDERSHSQPCAECSHVITTLISVKVFLLLSHTRPFRYRSHRGAKTWKSDTLECLLLDSAMLRLR